MIDAVILHALYHVCDISRFGNENTVRRKKFRYPAHERVKFFDVCEHIRCRNDFWFAVSFRYSLRFVLVEECHVCRDTFFERDCCCAGRVNSQNSYAVGHIILQERSVIASDINGKVIFFQAICLNDLVNEFFEICTQCVVGTRIVNIIAKEDFGVSRIPELYERSGRAKIYIKRV